MMPPVQDEMIILNIANHEFFLPIHILGLTDVSCLHCVRTTQVKTVMVEKKASDIVNRLNKTCEERQPDLRAEREERDRQERLEKRRVQEEEVCLYFKCGYVFA